jgi:hypothetical protein
MQKLAHKENMQKTGAPRTDAMDELTRADVKKSS